jgi:hypothetical protein
MRRSPFVLILLAAVFFFAQEANVQPAKTASSPKPSVTAATAKPKLTEQQKRGLNLLESTEASAGGLEPASRIVVYTQIARVYQTNNKKKAVELLQQAYDSLRTLQLDSPDKNLNEMVKNQLQRQVLNQYASLAPERVDALIDQMEPTMRDQTLRVLLPYYEKSKNLDRPVSILLQLAVEREMPYGAANDVIDKLGPEHPDEIRQLFFASLASYQNRQHSELNGSTEFANLISKAYGKVPDQAVATAIDEVLAQAKKADEETANVTVDFGFEKASLQFKSAYDTQLFAALPTLKQVDPEKAKRLLKESEDVNTFASKYPGGMSSMSKSGRPRSVGTHEGNGGAGGAQSSQLLEEQRMNAIIRDATDHPNDALANATTLSPSSAISAYMGIARENLKKNNTVAETALTKAQDLLPKAPIWQQMQTVGEIINVYELLGNKENAQKTIELGTKIAELLYKQEMEADDPNLAPKAWWMSTNAWRNLVDTSYELDPEQSATLLKEAPDDEVRVFAQIALAKRMIGNTVPSLDVSMSASKKGWMMSMSTMAIPEKQEIETREMR